MRVRELLQRYREGERDFRGLSLRDADFRGADLAGADFSKCHLQGTNFTGANLTGARFCAVKTGLSKPWAAIAMALGGPLSIGIVSLVGTPFIVMFLAATATVLASPQEVKIWAVAITVLYLALAIATTRRGIGAGWKIFVGALAVSIVVSLTATILGALLPANVAIVSIFNVMAKVSFSTFVAGAGMTMALGTGIAAGAFAGVEIVPGLLVALITVFGASIGALIGAVGAAMGAPYGEGISYWFSTSGYLLIAIGIPVVASIQGLYLGFRPLRGDRRDRWLRHRTLQLVSIFGTRFTQANLTGTDFSDAILKHANFQKALCDRACFRNASHLSLACDCDPEG